MRRKCILSEPDKAGKKMTEGIETTFQDTPQLCFGWEILPGGDTPYT